MMEALFFGEPSHRLYGVYHPPQRVRTVATGVLLCYPAGGEYIRIHRAYRWLADQLAARGFHVLRFDYTGQGNSAGTFGQAGLGRWITDASVALEELVASTGIAQVCVLGVRIGALVAAALAPRPEVRRLVLWEFDPRGSTYCDELLRHLDRTEPAPDGAVEDGPHPLPILGFPWPSDFLEELSDHVAETAPLRTGQAVLLVSAAPAPQVRPFADRCRAAGAVLDVRVIDSPTNWTSIDDMGGLYLPVPTLEELVEWLDAEA